MLRFWWGRKTVRRYLAYRWHDYKYHADLARRIGCKKSDLHHNFMYIWGNDVKEQFSYHKEIDADELCLVLQIFCAEHGLDRPRFLTDTLDGKTAWMIKCDLKKNGRYVALFRAFDIKNCQIEVKEEKRYEVTSSCINLHNQKEDK